MILLHVSMREKANLSPEDTIIAPSVLFVQSGLRNRTSLTLRANESEGRKHNSFPPTAPPLPPSWIPTIHSTARAHTHSNAISSARSGLYSVPLSLSLFLPISPPSSPSFVRSVTQNYNDDAAAAADPT